MAILAVLIWKFAVNTDYFLYSIGAAILVTIGVIFLVYHSHSGSAKPQNEKISKSDSITDDETLDSGEENEKAIPESTDLNTEDLPVEVEDTDLPVNTRKKPEATFRSVENRPSAFDVAAKYFQMSKQLNAESQDTWKPVTKSVSNTEIPGSLQPDSEAGIEDLKEKQPEGSDENPENGEPPIPLIDDETTLTLDEKNQLVNAVWYRCENPYCKYTSFLGVHHIVDEKDGGTNKLDNLIVLCPYCHDLAHRRDIPEKEMRDWISNREDRFKFKPDWHYF